MRKAGNRRWSQCLLQAIPQLPPKNMYGCTWGPKGNSRVCHASESPDMSVLHRFLLDTLLIVTVFRVRESNGHVRHEHAAALPYVLPHSQAWLHVGWPRQHARQPCHHTATPKGAMPCMRPPHQSSSSYSQMGMRYMRVLPRSSMRHSAAAPGLLRLMPGPAWSQLASAHSDDSSLYSTCTGRPPAVSNLPCTAACRLLTPQD